MGLEELVVILTNRRLYSLAFHICEAHRLKTDSVVIHWACTKLEHSLYIQDAMLYVQIASKTSKMKDSGLAIVAECAIEQDRKELAILLLSHASAASSIPVYLSFNQYQLALDVAIKSGDVDLVYLVFLSTPTNVLLPLLHEGQSLRMYISFLKKRGDLDGLKSVYYAMNLPREAANVLVLEAYKCRALDARIKGLEIAESFYVKTDPFSAKALQTQLNLLVIQKEEEKKGYSFVDLSLTNTLERYISVNINPNGASQLKSLFNIPDTRYYHILVKTLSQYGYLFFI